MTGFVSLERAVELLLGGGVVAVPTDTVYGVSASLGHRSAIGALFALKHRPSSVALPVLVDAVSQIELLGVTWSESAWRLSETLWPGALTIVVPAPPALAALVGSATNTVGFRLPNDQLLRELLAMSGPLAVTSANEHGEAPCSSAEEVLEVFVDRHELSGVLDGGQRSGQVSTVVDLSGPRWRVVRAGAISGDVLAAILD